MKPSCNAEGVGLLVMSRSLAGAELSMADVPDPSAETRARAMFAAMGFTFNERPESHAHFQAAVIAIREALLAEREACIQAVCERCRQGIPLAVDEADGPWRGGHVVRPDLLARFRSGWRPEPSYTAPGLDECYAPCSAVMLHRRPPP